MEWANGGPTKQTAQNQKLCTQFFILVFSYKYNVAGEKARASCVRGGMATCLWTHHHRHHLNRRVSSQRESKQTLSQIRATTSSTPFRRVYCNYYDRSSNQQQSGLQVYRDIERSVFVSSTRSCFYSCLIFIFNCKLSNSSLFYFQIVNRHSKAIARCLGWL